MTTKKATHSGSSRSRLRVVVVGVLLLALLGVVVWRSMRTGHRKNVLVIYVDTLNRSALRTYAPEAQELPILDSLADRSAVFEASSTASWTLPAYTSMATGLFSDHHGVVHSSRMLGEQTTTWGEQFGASGYETVAFTDGGYTSDAFGLAKGFEQYNDKAPGELGIEFPRDGKPSRVLGANLFDRGISYLTQRDDDRPFFLVLQTYMVHDYFKQHPWARKEVRPRRGKRGKKEFSYTGCMLGKRTCSDEDWSYLQQLYDAEMRRLDAGIGELLDELERQGLREDTLVVLVSDHGEGFEPHRKRIHHGGRLHQDVVRIPMMVAGPGIQPGKFEQDVSLADLMPTLLDLAGLPLPDGLDGVSLAAATAGGALPARPVFASEFGYFWNDAGERVEAETVPAKGFAHAVIQDDAWLIQTTEGAEELYDSQQDPQQAHNIIDEAPKADPLRQTLRSRKVTHQAGQAKGDEEVSKQLKSLGYF